MLYKLWIVSALTIASMISVSPAVAQEGDMQQAPATDNTRLNKRDRDKAQPTADQQKENRSDRDLTKQVRRALVKDKSLSTYAHNVKIISRDGKVTLKGPVRSEDEKQAIEAKAIEVAGQGNVTNDIHVAASNKNAGNKKK
jgi:hyperosmotically inducible periplasmic protein